MSTLKIRFLLKLQEKQIVENKALKSSNIYFLRIDNTLESKYQYVIK